MSLIASQLLEGMFFSCSKSKKGYQPTMSQKVPVFDPKTKDLRKLRLRNLNGPLFPAFSEFLKSMLIKILESDFDKVKVPGWQRHFDVYEYLKPGSSLYSYTVVSRQTDKIGGRFLCRLDTSGLGIYSEVQRKLSSKHRWLYIGAMPDV